MALAAIACAVPGAAAQGIPVVSGATAGSDRERYARALELVGLGPPSAWMIRGHRSVAPSPARGRPWSHDSTGGAALAVIDPRASLIFNSSHPYGFNDGPVWAGKGLTAVVAAGVTAKRGPLSVAIAPTAFVAQNGSFSLGDNGLPDDRRYADWYAPMVIDQPQRYGNGVYGRVDPGESEIRVEGFGLAGGASSRAEVWGPAYDHPIILGNNAGGIPRLFAGTAGPVGISGVRVNGRVIWGMLDESGYGPDADGTRRHFATGVAGSVGFSRIPGLELGAARFFHTAWPRSLQSAPWLRVVQAFINKSAAADTSLGLNPDNQLASAFFRVAPPGAGIEFYGEYGREDRNSEFRDLLLEPDHIAAYMVGFARGWADTLRATVTVLRAEVINTRISHLQQGRPQAPWYVHGAASHGHTLHGQVLASAGGLGGGASVVSLERFHPEGRLAVRWDRVMRATPLTAGGLPENGVAHVTQALTVERARFAGAGEIVTSGTLSRDFNRYFNSDVTNVSLSLSYRILR